MTDEAPGAPDVADTPHTPDTPDAPVAEPAPITLTLDGRTVDAQPDELLITCAERHGTYIPRFCWHPRMKPVGMCRMCLVEVEGVRGLPPACTLPAAEGMVVRTDTPQVVRAQEAVLEFLLVNHPLDCPVCDRGGECPLQDQVMSHGPGESRFVEEKRHWEKPIRLGPLVLLDRERCIQCARCTRFCDEIAGEPQLDFFERGARTEVGVHPGQPLTTYFSGNTVQICPVGALLEAPYRFRARPWDLDQAESTCTVCAVGCRMVLQSSMDRLVRHVGVDDDAVNQSWLCDKGRFAHEAIDSDERLTRPLVRRDGELVEAGWGEALQATARRLQDVLADGGPERVGVIGGSRLPNEDAYAWVKLAKGILGTDNVDAQLGDGLPGRLVVAAPRATIDDTCRAGAVVTLAADLRETLPVLYLRLRGAVLDQDLRLVELTPAPTSLTPYASASVGYRPGGAADCVDRVVEAVGDAEDVVLVLGRPSLAAGPEDALAVAARLAERLPGLRVLSALSRGNVHGALDMGMAPGLLPGRVPLGDPCAALRARWPTVPTEEGLDTVAMLRAAAAGRLDMLILLGADPLDDVPDRDLAERALDALPFLVATDLFLTGSSRRADVVLPAAGLGERPGTTTNLEGRVTRLAHKVTPPGTARPDWLIAAELAWQLGTDLGVDGLDGLWDEVELVAPSHRGVHRSLLGQARYRDGLVVPLDGSPPESRRGFGDIATDLYLAGAEQTPSRRFAVEPGLTPQHVEVRPGRAPARAAPTEVPGPGGIPITPVPADEETRIEPLVAAASAAQPEAAEVVLANPELQYRAAAAEPGRGQSAAGYRRGPARDPRQRPDAPPGEGHDADGGPDGRLALVAVRPLFGGGTLVERSRSLGALAPPPVARLHPDDAAARDLAPGDRARIATPAGAVELPVSVDERIVPGTVVVPVGGEVGVGALLQAGEAAAAAVVTREEAR